MQSMTLLATGIPNLGGLQQAYKKMMDTFKGANAGALCWVAHRDIKHMPGFCPKVVFNASIRRESERAQLRTGQEKTRAQR